MIMLNKWVKSLLTMSIIAALTSCTSHTPATPSTNTATLPSSANFHHYRLDNGLTVILKEDHRSPIVMTQIWYHVGSNHEEINKGGLAHFLEHMMFKDNTLISGDDYHRLIATLGGQKNAFTSNNYTAYYTKLPANQYPVALQIEAARMANLIIDPKLVAIENQVIQEERRQRIDSKPIAQAFEQFNSNIFTNSPQGRPIIGSMKDIQNLNSDDLGHFYQQFYTPNNATLVLVGDFQSTQAKSFIQEYFGHIAKTPTPTTSNSLNEPSHKGYQKQHFCGDIATPMLIMGFNVPSLTTQPKDAYALALLQDISDGGLSARFEKSLVRHQQLFDNISASFSPFHQGDTTFVIYATPKQGVGLDVAKQAILDELNNITTDNITDDELLRANNQLAASLIFANDSIDNQARMYGMLSAINLPANTIDTLADTLKTITKDDIWQVRQKYLTTDNLTLLNAHSCQ